MDKENHEYIFFTTERKHKGAVECECISDEEKKQIEEVMGLTDIDGIYIRVGSVESISGIWRKYLDLLEMDVIVR